MDSARGVAAIVVFCRNSPCNSSCDAIVCNGRRTVELCLLYSSFPKMFQCYLSSFIQEPQIVPSNEVQRCLPNESLIFSDRYRSSLIRTKCKSAIFGGTDPRRRIGINVGKN